MDYWKDRAEENGIFYVNCWGSHPEDDNDDCWAGVSSPKHAIAKHMLFAPERFFSESTLESTAVIQLIGPDGVEEYRRIAADVDLGDPDDSDWQLERAMQAGMAFGCQGYNDTMGY